MRKNLFLMTVIVSFLISACQPVQATPALIQPSETPMPSATLTPSPTEPPLSTPTPKALVPNFSHIVIFIFENKEYGTVINNKDMPYFNLLASSFTLLDQYYAVTHPSLPNYLSIIGGDTFGIVDDCYFVDCRVDAKSLPDLIEASGRTWKTYQDDMPDPCYQGDTLRYVKKHNPFMYFDSIRFNETRCTNSVVPLTQLDVDIAANALPNFIFITPDICYSAHDCTLDLADGWLKDQMEKIYHALDATGEPYLIVVTWDEGQGTHSCCGLPEAAGGRVATILISPQVKTAFKDSTPYSHYSLLKTISEAWKLPYLGHAADTETTLMTAPWNQ
ncbi:MAG: alkaline phosphatase family protein [Anaerolineales bacterium]